MRTSCIRLRANSRLAILFEDFLEICDGDMLAALLLAILVYWTDIKLAKKDTNLWIWKSHEDFQEDLMVDKPGMKPPHRTTISNKLDFLQAKDFIEWRKNPKLALDRTRHYLVHLPAVQAAIDRLPPIVSRKTDIRLLENRHSTEAASEDGSDSSTNVEKPTYVECRKSNIALSEKQHCIVGKPTSNTNDYITEITDSEITEEGTYGANAPTRPHVHLSQMDEDALLCSLAAYRTEQQLIGGHLHIPGDTGTCCLQCEHDALEAIVEERQETVKRITDKHKAVKPNETLYHIANSRAIGNDEDDEDTAKREAVKIGATHAATNRPGLSSGRSAGSAADDRDSVAERLDEMPAVRLQAVAAGQAPSLPIDDPERQSTVLEHTPGTPSPLPLAAGTADVLSRHGDAGSDQATSRSLLPSEPAQASGRRRTVPERPKGVRKPPVMPDEPPKITLTAQEQAFWELWCNLFFNKDIAPDLTMTAYGHVRKLAPHITSAEQMESLAKRARKDLEDNTGVKRKTVYLGNCVNSYPGWKQEQAVQAPPGEEKPPQDKYTAASRDEERNERGLQRLRDRITARGEKPPC